MIQEIPFRMQRELLSLHLLKQEEGEKHLAAETKNVL